MDRKQRRIAFIGAVILVVGVLIALYSGGETDTAQGEVAATPVLAVVMARAQFATLPRRIPATGNIAPWQEASVGTEAEGLQLTEVRVNVGDRVRRGQVLAVFKPEMVAADLAEAEASVAQAQAQLMEAEANAERARRLDASGAMSAQQINAYLVAARTARARLDAAKAVAQRNRLRLAQARVLAPSDGIIIARTATVGAVMPGGQELFRLIKEGRLEWRATVAMSELSQLAPGQVAEISVHGQPPLQGRLRIVGPSIDTQTHNGLVYVDLPINSQVRAGAFARGFFEVGEGQALTVPQQAVLLRDGFSYVMRLDPQAKILMTKVSVGRRVGDRVEITGGLEPSEPIVASGLSFLSEGDTVKVVSAPAASAPASATTLAGGAP
ncbi:efflux RND transporter periplasmic adaptor subunit [Pseudoxanthomonas sacheonensis]|uniref:RND family efflux transporter MFP subunit n=1 Tax=Pseudoxanthomonas sacheonensis TaxID=443615 RepID=A0ABU1RQS7_9GAMM|nr:efflux RND transporter periplasmic adaptor subunit [Pseudoxanthomonas sacheonensis]MDR6841128.1 RND family efflux transporter MFP subunit [Pseudoxanthomonas sacheonensis]